MLREGHQQALRELEAIADARPGAVEILDHELQVNGWLWINITIDCRGWEHRDGGIRLRAREPFRLGVPPAFPFQPPSIWVRHRRWATTNHVQWGGHLCVYRSAEIEWNPTDGMFGFIDPRLTTWLKRAALDDLDPVGEPLHPPVTYAETDAPLIVPRVDTPGFSDQPWWTGFASLRANATGSRLDIVGWRELTEGSSDGVQAAAILLGEPMPWEFPARVQDLIDELKRQHYSANLLFSALQVAAIYQPRETPLYVVIGTPMRRIGDRRIQHLTAWRIPAFWADALRDAVPRGSDSDELLDVRDRMRRVVEDGWAANAAIEWCPVREDRPEATEPRDTGSPMRWWHGKTAHLWGCGAVGGHIAEHLTRAGVRSLVLRDDSVVAPGVLGRQNFEEDDLGEPKASALARRLRLIRPDVEVSVFTTDVMADQTLATDWAGDADVVIDATASIGVSKRLELLRRRAPKESTAVVSFLIGHKATQGLVAVCPPSASGGPADAIRKAKILASRKPRLAGFAGEFWPVPPRTEMFQPEPGCSNPTFTGSDVEVAGLAATMLLASSQRLHAGMESAAATFVELPDWETRRDARSETVELPNDLVVMDQFGQYEVRIAAGAVAEIRAWSNRAERLTPEWETGGVLFGERDDAVGVVWVSDVLGPPPDSVASADGFICGREGVDEAATALNDRSRDASKPVGLWHTHPGTDPHPSPTDRGGMEQVVGDPDRPLPCQLLLIIGGLGEDRTIGAYVYDRRRSSALPQRPTHDPFPPAPVPEHEIGLALSGGGFRAVAFHLGVLRALHDRGVLDHVAVLSAVSGGSVIGALWAYGGDDFQTFDKRIVKLLKRGLTGDIAKAALLSENLPKSAASALLSGSGNFVAAAVGAGRRVIAGGRRRPAVEPPFRRWASRATSFKNVLAEHLFGDATIDQPLRPIHVVINACELRTGSAFRFGSSESGCTRYGKLVDNAVPVAEAVAASAAYPVLLPALDVRMRFRSWKGEIRDERVLLTDGGVYDNLGTTCLEPGRKSRHSTNVHPVDYIISCDAGQGVLDKDAWPLWWPSRMKRSFESLYRKVQDAEKSNLHDHVAAGTIKGFAMPFLGMFDGNLPVRPPGLVTRSEVVGYRTDFSPMSDEDLSRLTRRGEQLTRAVIEHHCPELS